MSQSHLASCPSCARHVRVSESACPFCRGALSDAFRATPARPAPRARLARAALFAIGTGTVALTPACSASSSGSPGTGEPGDGSSVVADSGESVSPEAGTSTGSDAGTGATDAAGGQDAPTVEPAYGAIAYGDAGVDSGGFTAQPLYGAAAYGAFPGH
jgi:hypothetical protein